MNTFFSPEEEQLIVQAIAKAELQTSGEIKLHVESRCWFSAMWRAKKLFALLNLQDTAQKNGVLIYIAIKSRKFAILGDAGINELVGQNFWNQTKEIMQSEFRNGNFFAGAMKGIESAGEQLRHHFPFQKNDTNELSNDVSYGK
ncbi:MAG: TPM domain-containing protein [Bacteroidetes bacterium]|nr:TPM domain-containing protein [Bacteroidota bacterium]MBK9673420.1 TPM domain-containing protein [Bacteroidota bacterium]MBK9800842.1 TPM domain-containing protein [Bacteroidota bacterium]MBP6412607.1 TPM domain-containing protein [Bacteroidia bacterium]